MDWLRQIGTVLPVTAGLYLGSFFALPAQVVDNAKELIEKSMEAYRLRQYESEKKSEAVALAERAVTLLENLSAPNHRDLAEAISWLAALYADDLRRYNDAERLYMRALGIVEQQHLEIDLYSEYSSALIRLYTEQGRHDDADAQRKRRIAFLEKMLGPDHVEVANAFDEQGDSYLARGRRRADAQVLFDRASAIRDKQTDLQNRRRISELEKTHGAEDPAFANGLTEIARSYLKTGRSSEAEPLLKRAMAIQEKADADALYKNTGGIVEHFSSVFGDLIGLYRSKGRHADADALLLQRITFLENKFGRHHQDVARALKALAYSYSQHGREAAADELLKRLDARPEDVFACSKSDLKACERVDMANCAQGYSDACDDIAKGTIRLPSPAKSEREVRDAILYYKLDSYDLALTYLNARTFRNAQFDSLPSLYLLRGTIRTAKGQHDRAIADFSDAIRFKEMGIPLGLDSYLYRRASAYYETKRFPDSLIDIDRALQDGGARPSYHLLRGKILIALGRAPDAKPAFEQTLLQLDDADVDLDPAAREEMYREAKSALASGGGTANSSDFGISVDDFVRAFNVDVATNVAGAKLVLGSQERIAKGPAAIVKFAYSNCASAGAGIDESSRRITWFYAKLAHDCQSQARDKNGRPLLWASLRILARQTDNISNFSATVGFIDELAKRAFASARLPEAVERRKLIKIFGDKLPPHYLLGLASDTWHGQDVRLRILNDGLELVVHKEPASALGNQNDRSTEPGTTESMVEQESQKKFWSLQAELEKRAAERRAKGR